MNRWFASAVTGWLLAGGGGAPAMAGGPGHGDMTPAHSNVELRYGSTTLSDSVLGALYGSDSNGVFRDDTLLFEAGPQIFRLVEIDFGAGFLKTKSEASDVDGVASGETIKFTMVPLSLSATARLHFWDEQFLVPFASYGVDYVLWFERHEVGDGHSATRGGKAGTHFAVGGNLLLDVFGRRRAGLLEARTGINDTWLVVEWRRQRIEPGQFLWMTNSSPLSFSGDTITVGLKLDY